MNEEGLKKKETIRTADLNLAAYLFALGFSIQGLFVTKELDRDLCIITFEGESLQSHHQSYLSNKAKVDPVLFQKAVNRIKDIVFDALDKAKETSKHRGGNV